MAYLIDNWRNNSAIKVYKRLNKSDFTDPLSLALAGLYDSLLNLGTAPTFLKACAHAGIGEFPPCLEHLKTLDLRRYKSLPLSLRFQLLSRINLVNPGLAQEYSHILVGKNGDYIHSLIHSNSEPDCPLLSINHFLRNRPDLAEAKWNQFFESHQIEAPSFPISNGKLCLQKLSVPCPPPHPSPVKVSVILTAFNAEGHIATSLKSILDQTWKNIEIIVVDDASTDSTYRIAEKVLSGFDKYKIIRNKENKGTYRSRNIALREASGDLIMNHDADDWAHPQKVEIQALSLITTPYRVACTSRWLKIKDESGLIFSPHLYPLFRHCTNSIMFRKETLSLIQGFEEVRSGADEKFETQILLTFGPTGISRIKKPLTIGSHSESCLTARESEGINCHQGLFKRAKYRETWLPGLIKNSSYLNA